MAGYIGSKASVVSSGAERKKTFAITTSTTSLTGLAYTPNQVHVFHNGIRLVDGTDYTATDGTTITLTNAAANGDEVVVVSYAAFQTSDTVSASAGGTFAGDVAINGDLTVDTDALFVDASTNNVGIGTSSPSQPLEVNGFVRLGDEAGSILDIRGSATSADGILISSTYYGSGGFGPIKFNTSNSEAMRIDNAGRVTMPYQPSFRATMAGTSFSGDGAGTVIPFPTVSGGAGMHNRGNHFNASTGRFTAPVAGSYYFDSIILAKTLADGNIVEIFLTINGAISVADGRKAYEPLSTGWGDGYINLSISTVFSLSAGDIVDVRWATNDSTPSLHASSSSSHFAGFLLG